MKKNALRKILIIALALFCAVSLISLGFDIELPRINDDGFVINWLSAYN